MKESIHKAVKVLVLAAILIAGCFRAGSEFLGKWVNKANADDPMEIVRNGDQYMRALCVRKA
jgi:hypothetical protein